MQRTDVYGTRTVTLVVAIATLTSNALSSVLFSQLPNDPYHLASKFGWYLHLANVLSVFGFIGALRQHALSIAIFANYLVLDTVFCAIPRFLIPILLNQLSSTLCSTSYYFTPSVPGTHSLSFSSPQLSIHTTNSSPFAPTSGATAPTPAKPYLNLGNESWSPAACFRIVQLAQLTLIAGVVAAAILQFTGALCVRAYARSLWMKELREEVRVYKAVERRIQCEERGLPIIDEIEDESEDGFGEKA